MSFAKAIQGGFVFRGFMARINIEEEFFSDLRLDKLSELCGKKTDAIGCLVLAWREAQRYWVRDKGLIPSDVWAMLPNNNLLVSSGFAVGLESGFYMKGSEEKFSWVLKLRENGQKGGRPKKSSKKRENNGLQKPIGYQQDTYRVPIENPPSPSPSLSLSPIQKNIKEIDVKSIIPEEILDKIDITLPEIQKLCTLEKADVRKIFERFPIEYIMECVEEMTAWIRDNYNGKKEKFTYLFVLRWIKRHYNRDEHGPSELAQILYWKKKDEQAAKELQEAQHD